MSRLTLFTTLAALLLAPAVFAENGTSGAAFLLRPIGARAAAMGQAFTAVPGTTADSLLYNPASTAFISSRTISANYLNGYAGDKTGFLGYAQPLGPIVITPAVFYYNAGAMNLNLSDGTQGTVTAEEDTMLIGAVALRPLSFLAIGAAFKYWNSSLAQTASAKGTSCDLGAMAALPMGFMAGAALQNIGGDVKYEEVADPSPQTQRFGLSWHRRMNPSSIDSSTDYSAFDIIIDGDYSKTRGEAGYYQSGMEISMNPYGEFTFALRGGYMFDRDNQTATFGSNFWTASGNSGDFALTPSTYPGAPEQQRAHCAHSKLRPRAYHTERSTTGVGPETGSGTPRDGSVGLDQMGAAP